MTQCLIQSKNKEAVLRTVPATPSLSKIDVIKKNSLFILYKDI